jgi:alpha-tubulin suppressor-like RCC1 family protein
MEDSTAYSFGDGGGGRLGHGDDSNQQLPKKIDGLVAVRSCSAGYDHSVRGGGRAVLMARSVDSHLACAARSCLRLCSSRSLHAAQICVMEDSTAYSFGDGGGGRLGHGDDSNQLLPKKIDGLVAVRSCSAGSGHSVSARGRRRY